MGNPPFQEFYQNKVGRVGGSSLWSKFINYSFELVKNDGYFVFISPCGWMTGSTNKQSGNILQGVFHKNTLLELNIEECAKHFSRIGSSFTYYVLQKTVTNATIHCVCKYRGHTYFSNIEQCVFRRLSKLLTNDIISIIFKMENAD